MFATNPRIIHVKRVTSSDFIANLAIIVSLLLLILGTLGLVFLPKILSSSSFDNRPSAVEVKSCNEPCHSNNECEANHFCYQNRCRYPLNPESETCSTALPSPTPQTTPVQPDPKGGSSATGSSTATGAAILAPLDPAATGSSRFDPTATNSATGAGALRLPSPSPSPLTSSLPAPMPEEQNALDSVLGYLHNQGVPINLLPYLAIAVGVVLLLIILMPKFIKMVRKFGGPSGSANSPTSGTAGPTTLNNHEQALQQKIQELRQQPQQVPQQQPVQQPPVQQPAAPMQQQPVQQQPTPSQPPSTNSSMVGRLQQKGIQRPGQSN